MGCGGIITPVKTDCISLLYTVCGFWGKNRPSAANVESRQMLEPQGEAKRAPPGKTPFLNYEIAQKRTDAEFELVDIKDFNLPLLGEPMPPNRRIIQ